MVENPARFNRPAVKTILLAEDDTIVNKCVQRMLERDNFQVLPARHGEEALDIWKQRKYRVDLLLTDLNMPGLSGLELSERLTSDAKDLKTLFISGHPDLISDAEDVPEHLLLQKPFTADRLLRKIKATINAPLHGWICLSCRGRRYQGSRVDCEGYTTRINFFCVDCGMEYIHVSEVTCFHMRCPLCNGPVLLGGYGYVGGRKGTWYLEKRCWGCETKIVHHSLNCPVLPYAIYSKG